VHFLVTGHTGFKGSWLTEMLLQLGHSVSGMAYNTDEGTLYSVCNSKDKLSNDLEVDIRNREEVAVALQAVSPDFVIHLAAQALVRKSYLLPTETFDTNFTGTMNVMIAAEETPSVKGILVITTDKVYKNDNSGKPFSETDPLGANDPYSASKAAADLYAQSFSTFSKLKSVVVRAGNVIGGGDVCLDRLVPDVVTKIRSEQTLELRYPQAIRPWQHVLDCLDGYLTILANWQRVPNGSVWNVGPDPTYQLSVLAIVNELYGQFGVEPKIRVENNQVFKESISLSLDVSKLKEVLGHSSRLTLEETVSWTANFHRRVWSGESPQEVIQSQVSDYLNTKSQVSFGSLSVEHFL
jgi:CDP-glucose 4,6-dehydratase